MEHKFLHLIMAPLVQQPECELTPNEHSMYIRFLWIGHIHCRIGQGAKVSNNLLFIDENANKLRQCKQGFKAPWACSIKHYGFVMHVICSKLVCLSEPVKVTYNNKNTSLLYPYSVNYISVMLYSTGSWSQYHETFLE